MKSWGDSSMSGLFKQIDEIEDDLNSLVLSMPGINSHVQTIETPRGNTRRMKKQLGSRDENEPDPTIPTLKKSYSFDSTSTGGSIAKDVLQRMSHIKEYIAQIDTAGSLDSVDTPMSPGDMSDLMQRLTDAADELRAISAWDD